MMGDILFVYTILNIYSLHTLILKKDKRLHLNIYSNLIHESLKEYQNSTSLQLLPVFYVYMNSFVTAHGILKLLAI